MQTELLSGPGPGPVATLLLALAIAVGGSVLAVGLVLPALPWKRERGLTEEEALTRRSPAEPKERPPSG